MHRRPSWISSRFTLKKWRRQNNLKDSQLKLPADTWFFFREYCFVAVSASNSWSFTGCLARYSSRRLPEKLSYFNPGCYMTIPVAEKWKLATSLHSFSLLGRKWNFVKIDCILWIWLLNCMENYYSQKKPTWDCQFTVSSRDVSLFLTHFASLGFFIEK